MDKRLPLGGPLVTLLACSDGTPVPREPPRRGEAVAAAAPAPDPVGQRTAPVRQTVYVPAYSHIFIRDERRTIDLAVTLSVRNTDPEHAVTLASVRYFDDGGRPVRAVLAEPRRLAPMASAAFVVEERDRTAGVGASFVVEWTADAAVAEPLVEAVMISTASSLGISFTSRGRPVTRR